MKTAALAAYIQSRKMKFAGAPVTLAKILQMWQLPHDAQSETVDLAVISGVARYCKMTPSELVAAVEAMAPPEPVPLVTFQTVTVPAPAPAPVSKPMPEPTAVIPQEQLGDLVAASRPSSPVIEAPAPETSSNDDDAEIDVSFEDVEATPIPEAASVDAKAADAKSADAKPSKSKNKRKKKS